MAKRNIISLNFKFPGHDDYISFRSDRSLLDADLIVVEPSITTTYYSRESHQGKPLLSESDSFKVLEDMAHWRSELRVALDEGKTVFVFLTRFETFFVYTGTKDYSGTGRNRAVTNHVSPADNYSLLPTEIGRIVSRSGKEIRVAKDLGPLSSYWKNFAENSAYEAYLEGKFDNALLTTKTGSKVVGAIVPEGKGNLVLLPTLTYDIEDFIEYDEEDEEHWNQKGVAFGKKLITSLVEVDKALGEGKEATPTPDWTQDLTYRLESERTLEKRITKITDEIEDLRVSQSQLIAKLEEEGKLRSLLFEKGHRLEESILESLRLLGFKVERYKDSESEFDAVFVSPEGRFVGEAEGKDNKAVNVDKLSQLERVLQEDFARDEVDEYAKGVLLETHIDSLLLRKREDFFTRKCVSGAQRSKVALVRTTDLFTVAKYVVEAKDSAFARACREAIAQTEGQVVEFPAVPIEEKGKRELKVLSSEG